MIEQLQSDKFCRGCATWKPITEFGIRIDRPCRVSRCTTCSNADSRERKAAARARRKVDRPERMNETAREKLAKRLCAEVQTYWHIPVSGQLVGWRIRYD